jgi:hypothetical protein
VKCYMYSTALYGAELGHFGKYVRNIWKVLKCGAGEGWRRPTGPIAWELKKQYRESRRTGISYKE